MAVTASSRSQSAPKPSDALDWPVSLRLMMGELAEVEWRLNVSAARRCLLRENGLGFKLDSLQSYSTQARSLVARTLHLGNAIEVAVIVPGGPADQAGLKLGDILASPNGAEVAMDARGNQGGWLAATKLERELAGGPIGAPVHLTIKRGQEVLSMAVLPKVICKAPVFLEVSGARDAHSDGESVSVSSGLIEFVANRDELAMMVGHEIAHVMNRDKKAKSLRDRREWEKRADRDGLALLVCAGYDGGRAIGFFNHLAGHEPLSFLRESTHEPSRIRAKALENQLKSIQCPHKEKLPDE